MHSQLASSAAVTIDIQLHTHHPFNGPFSGTTRVSRYQKGKTNLDFIGARDSEWQWHLLGHIQVCTLLQTDNHASTPPLSFFTGRMPFLPPNQQRQSTEGNDHRHRIDKYVDTLLSNQPISDSEATNHCQKVTSQDGRLPQLIVAQSCLTNHSKASRLWLVTPKQDVVGNHLWRHWRVVCCNVEELNFGMQNLRPSNNKVIF